MNVNDTTEVLIMFMYVMYVFHLEFWLLKTVAMLLRQCGMEWNGLPLNINQTPPPPAPPLPANNLLTDL